MMKLLCQRDPLWINDKMGSSDKTLGRWGCTTTCLSMLSDYFKCYISPKELAHNAYNYTTDGLVWWAHLNFRNFKFVRRSYNPSFAEIDNAIKDPNKAVILQVNNGLHWVVPTAKIPFKKDDYFIADPWLGKKVELKKVYKNITGAAFFERIK